MKSKKITHKLLKGYGCAMVLKENPKITGETYPWGRHKDFVVGKDYKLIKVLITEVE